MTVADIPLFGKMDWGNWLYGLFSGFIGGGAGAVVSGVSVSVMDPKDYAFGSSKFFTLVAVVFVTNGVMTALAYLHQHPLPSVVTVETVKTIEKPDQPTTTVTTVEKTTVGEKQMEPKTPGA